MSNIQIQRIDTVDSTNNYLKAIKNPGHGLVIISKKQEQGRGLGENRWESKTGENITGSINIVPSNISPMENYLISMAVAVAVCEFLDMFKTGSQIKWPNDIYFGNKKIAGILIENEILGSKMNRSIVGVGLNINQNSFSFAPNPTSLKIMTNKSFPVYKLGESLFEKILSVFESMQYNKIDTSRLYHKRLYKLNIPSGFKDKNGLFEGIIKEVAIDGQISITDNDNNVRKYYFKEVQFID